MPARARSAAFALLLMVISGCQQTPVNTGNASATTGEKSDDHQPPAYKSVRDMMRAKLAHAQAVLEGLAVNDMDQVETNANALSTLSTLSDWQAHRTMEYNLYSEDFRFASREMARHAREKKLHAATMDYVSLTLSCVKCHDYMAQAGLVRFDLRDDEVFPLSRTHRSSIWLNQRAK